MQGTPSGLSHPFRAWGSKPGALLVADFVFLECWTPSGLLGLVTAYANSQQPRDREFTAKHDFMMGTTVPETVPLGNDDRAAKLLKCGWSAMEVSESRHISQDELSETLGISSATLVNWSSRATKLAQIEAMLRILERLPASMREQLLDRVLRLFPTIDSPQFAHMPTAVSRFRSLVKQRTGLTIIQGEESSRTFVFTALGHSILQANLGPCGVRGIDVHVPDWFVPVPGITYVPTHGSRARLSEGLNSMWPRADHVGWFMLNGVLSAAPERVRQILTLIATHHVIIADDLEWQTSGLLKQGREMNVPIHIVEVAATDSRRISIQMRSL